MTSFGSIPGFDYNFSLTLTDVPAANERSLSVRIYDDTTGQSTTVDERRWDVLDLTQARNKHNEWVNDTQYWEKLARDIYDYLEP